MGILIDLKDKSWMEDSDLKQIISSDLPGVSITYGEQKKILKDVIMAIGIKDFDKNPDSNIVFSCFTSKENKVGAFQPNIWKRFYGTSHIKELDLIKYCNKNNLKINKHMSFSAQGGHVHEIFKIEKI